MDGALLIANIVRIIEENICANCYAMYVVDDDIEDVDRGEIGRKLRIK